MRRFSFIILIVTLAFSCSKDENEDPDRDPLIGTWYLVAIEQEGEKVDVTDQPCLQDSRFDVHETTLTLTLSAPGDGGNSTCQTESVTVEWINDSNTYYFVQDGNRERADIALRDDNRTLLVDIELGEEPLILIFGK